MRNEQTVQVPIIEETATTSARRALYLFVNSRDVVCKYLAK